MFYYLMCCPGFPPGADMYTILSFVLLGQCLRFNVELVCLGWSDCFVSDLYFITTWIAVVIKYYRQFDQPMYMETAKTKSQKY